MSVAHAETNTEPIRQHVTHCGVCGGSKHVPFYCAAHIVECEGCGVLFVSPRPTDQAIAAFYSRPGHYDGWDAELGRTEMWQRRLERAAALVPAGRLLDIGTGQGDFCAVARQRYEVDGTEISTEGTRQAKERHGLHLRVGDVLELDLPRAHYDIITIWHVLEHVAEPRALLERCRELLRPGGVVCIAVPNADSRLRMSRAEIKAHIQTSLKLSANRAVPFDRLNLVDASEEIHLTHFTMKTLCWLMRSIGFHVVESGIDDCSPHLGWKARGDFAFAALTYRWLGAAVGDALFVAGKKGAT